MHTPIINKFLLAASLIFVICAAFEFYRKRSLRHFALWWWFCALLLLSCWFAFNEQVITGMTVWLYLFVQYTTPLSVVVFLVLRHTYFSALFPRAWNLALGVAVAASLSVGVASAQSYKYLLDDFLLRQSYMPVFSWLNNNTPVDCVVLVDEARENLAMLIPAFTHCNTYVNTYTFFNIPEERVLHNFLVLLRLKGIAPQNTRAYLASHPGEVNGYLYNSIDQSLFSGINAETEQHIDEIVPAYQNFYRNNFESELKKYRIDYVLTTIPGALPTDLTLKKEAEIGTFTLYKLI